MSYFNEYCTGFKLVMHSQILTKGIANRPLNGTKIYELKIKDLDVFEGEEKK